MLGFGRPDRHALSRITPSKRAAAKAAPSRESGFVLRRIGATDHRDSDGPLSPRVADTRRYPPNLRRADSGVNAGVLNLLRYSRSARQGCNDRASRECSVAL